MTKRDIQRWRKRRKQVKQQTTKMMLKDQTCDNCLFFRSRGVFERCEHNFRKDSIPKERTCLKWQKNKDHQAYEWRSF